MRKVMHGCGGVREGGVLANHHDLFRTPSALYPATLYSSEATVYINQTGDKPQKQDTQANKRSPHLSEEVPYQITL